jgi:hypothetical protein
LQCATFLKKKTSLTKLEIKQDWNLLNWHLLPVQEGVRL